MADESRINEGAPEMVEKTDRGLFDFMKKKEDVAKPSDHDTMVSGVEKAHISEPEYRKEEKHESLLEKLKHSDSSSSSDEEDDEEKKRRKRERKEKKGGLKEKFGHKEEGHLHDEHHQYGDTNVPIEKVHHVQESIYSDPSYVAHPPQQHHDHHHVEPTYVEHPQYFESSPQHVVNDHVHQEADKKKQEGFMDKIKDKLAGHKDQAESNNEADAAAAVAAVAAAAAAAAAPVSAHHDESHVEGEEDKKGLFEKIKAALLSMIDAEEKDQHDEEKKEGGLLNSMMTYFNLYA